MTCTLAMVGAWGSTAVTLAPASTRTRILRRPTAPIPTTTTRLPARSSMIGKRFMEAFYEVAGVLPTVHLRDLGGSVKSLLHRNPRVSIRPEYKEGQASTSSSISVLGTKSTAAAR